MSAEYRVMVTGHRPDKLGGYVPCAMHQAVRGWLRGQLEAAQREAPPTAQVVAISGMALGVDQWFAEIAIELGIPFDAYVPFEGQEIAWRMEAQTAYRALLARARRVLVVCPGGYDPEKMHIRNCRMVDDAQRWLAVWDGSGGGTGACVACMKKRGIAPIRLNPRDLHV